MSRIIQVVRVALGLVVLVAGLSKLAPPERRFLFEMAISAYGLLDPEKVVWAAWVVPILEIALGTLLLVGWRAAGVGGVVTAMLLTFLVLQTLAYMHGIQTYCGCFGFGERVSQWTLARDGAALAAALLVSVGAWRGAHMLAVPLDGPPLRTGGRA